MKLKWMIPLFLVTLPSQAVELELGMAYSLNPFYYELNKDRYPYIAHEHLVGKVEVSQAFNIVKFVDFKVYAEHLSLLASSDPQKWGINMLGVGVVFR